MKVNGFEFQNRKVIVTGASGFKGAWLCAALSDMGAQVYGTIRNQVNPAAAYRIFGLEDRVVALNVDISDRQSVYDMVNTIEPDVIFHLAAKALVPVGLRDPRRTFDVNINGTLNVIEACRRVKVCSRMLICSTDHVFGNVEPTELPEGGFNERSRVSYGGPYDTSKAAMELLVRSYHFTFWNEVPAIGLTRCANVFGFGDTNLRRVIPLFVTSAKSDKRIPLRYRNNGRQFIYVTDAIGGYIKAMAGLDEGGCRTKATVDRPDRRTPFTPTYHFAIEQYKGTETPYIKMGALAELAAELFGAVVDDAECVDYAANENRIQALNCAATRKALNWHTQTTLADGLGKLGQWHDALGDPSALRAMLRDEVQTLVSSLGTPNSAHADKQRSAKV
jgi:CDP-glucose 4,6-dehydratase